jgi:hypothetical protein
LSDGISFSYLFDSWYEKFCDPLISELQEHRIPFFLMTPSREYFTPRRTPSMFIQPSLDRIRAESWLFSDKGTGQEQLDGFQKFMDFGVEELISPHFKGSERIDPGCEVCDFRTG